MWPMFSLSSAKQCSIEGLNIHPTFWCWRHRLVFCNLSSLPSSPSHRKRGAVPLHHHFNHRLVDTEPLSTYEMVTLRATVPRQSPSSVTTLATKRWGQTFICFFNSFLYVGRHVRSWLMAKSSWQRDHKLNASISWSFNILCRQSCFNFYCNCWLIVVVDEVLTVVVVVKERMS